LSGSIGTVIDRISDAAVRMIAPQEEHSQISVHTHPRDDAKATWFLTPMLGERPADD
jgi:hypothetical protein